MKEPATGLGLEQAIADVVGADDVGLEGELWIAFHRLDRNQRGKVKEVRESAGGKPCG